MGSVCPSSVSRKQGGVHDPATRLLCLVSGDVLGQHWFQIDKTMKTSLPLPLLLTLRVSRLSHRESRDAVGIDRSFQVHKPWDQQHGGRGQFK